MLTLASRMDPHQTNIKGLQLCARFYEDIQREWNLCKANTETLESLSVSDGALIYCMNEAWDFPKLKTLQIFLKGEVAMRYNRKPIADWRLVDDSLRRIKSWMTLHTFPSLEQLDIFWANNVMIVTTGVEEISTEKGLETICVDEFNYEYINMNAIFQHYGVYKKTLDIQWLKAFPIRTLNVSKAIYDVISNSECTFEVSSGPDFTQEDVEKMLERLNDY